jgi:PAS domain S-box-containing protein
MIAAETNPLYQTEYLSALLSSIDDSVVATDENFIIRYWNRKAEQFFAIPALTAIGKRSADILQFIYNDQSREEAREILLEKGVWKGKLNYACNDGTMRLLDASVTAVRNQEGSIIGYVGVHRDITDEDWARTSLSTFLSFISSSEDYVFVVDRNLHVAFIDAYTNQRLTDIYGFSYELGENVLDKLPASRKDEIKKCFQTALAGAKSFYEINITTVKGKNMWLNVSYFPVRNPNGVITHACSMVREITAQKEMDRVNQMLYKSRQLFETFMENSPILAWITSKAGVIKYLNPCFMKTFQLPKNAIGQTLEAIFPPEIAAAFYRNNDLVFTSGKSVKVTEHATTPAGAEHIYQVIKFPVASEEDVFIGGWAIDVTKENALQKSVSESLFRLKNSEMSLKQALEKELHLNDMKSRFVSMASHEFRTPLSTILSSIYLLEKYTTTEQQNSRLKHAGKIKEAIQHMNSLLEDFLTLGKLEEGKAVVATTDFSISRLVNDLVEELAPLKKNGQTIQLQFTGPDHTTSDKKIIKNILTNLLSNAFKFSDENKNIRLLVDITAGKIVLVVKDEGIGISKEDRMHLFQTFFRGRNAQNIQGTGLGLNIVQRYVELLKGEINLESELGRGTIVRVCLPLLS